MEPVVPPRLGPSASDLSLGPLDNNAPDQPIAVRSVAVDGVTIHSPADINALTGDLVGDAVSLRKIEAARLGLVKKYRDNGYPLVSVQATRRADGTLVFRVYEGHIVDVKLDGEDIGPAGTQGC